MKKLFSTLLPRKALFALILIGCAGCGTIWGGKITDCQKHKPTDGTHRQVRTGALIGDICTGGLWLIIDASDGGLYKPCKK